MAIRKIVRIDEEKCNGCGLCVPSCAEGAIQVIDGKARLVSDIYCDGLGACLGECPMDAISIEEREAPEFDEEKAMEHVARTRQAEKTPAPAPAFTCPGSAARMMERKQQDAAETDSTETPSALGNWPVQLNLVPPTAPYFENADILLAADCVPFAYADFHRKMLRDKVLLIGCPKLDDAAHYTEKLSEILKNSSVKSLTIARMEVPCCMGLTRIAETAVLLSGKDIPVNETIISIRGEANTGS